MPNITVPVEIPGWMAERLSVLIDPDRGLPDLAAVIGEMLDHVQQGVARSGAWERGWLEQAFGNSWQARLETDPESPRCLDCDYGDESSEKGGTPGA